MQIPRQVRLGILNFPKQYSPFGRIENFPFYTPVLYRFYLIYKAFSFSIGRITYFF